MSLQQLPDPLVAQLRSNLNIISLACALRELVQNALDASATRIDCWVDPATWSVKVSDNGTGISRHDLERVGVRYGEHRKSLACVLRSTVILIRLSLIWAIATSKARGKSELVPANTFGFRGEGSSSYISSSQRISDPDPSLLCVCSYCILTTDRRGRNRFATV
jgi:DNA mismatch repair ATPase MutL